MDSFPLITCFVLTYNHFSGLDKTLSAIFEQDYPNIELAVIDDGSADFPAEKIKEFVSEHIKDNIKRAIIFSNEHNLGTVKNLNVMLEKTSGKYLIGTSPDDYLYNSTTCSRVVNFFEKTKADLVASKSQILDADGHALGVMPSVRTKKIFSKASAKEQFVLAATGISNKGPGTMYARSVFEKAGPFDERYKLVEDLSFLLKACRSGIKVHFLDEITYCYGLGNGVSSGGRYSQTLIDDTIHIYQNEVLPYLEDFTTIQKRRVMYNMERIRDNRILSKSQKMKYILKYPDVVLYRRYMAH